MISEPDSSCDSNTLGYARPRPKRHGLFANLILAISIVLFALAFVLPQITRIFGKARITDYKDWCGSNLRGTWKAMLIYAHSDPNGAYPDDLEELIQANTVAPNQLNCPRALSLGTSYSYVTGLTIHSPPTSIVMFEHADNHRGGGGNVLYADGRVEFVAMSQLQSIMSEASTQGKIVTVKDMSDVILTSEPCD